MSQVLMVLWWWILVAIIGLLAWPLAFRLLRFVPDRGYSAARPLGLLLGTYAWWLLSSLGFLTTSLGSILTALVLVGILALWFYRAQHTSDETTLAGWLRNHRLYVIIYEIAFLAALAGWAYFRAHSPGINHTEKPMEFAFLNGILRSVHFPPNDPWLSGYGISYYYMGYVMLALLTRLSGTQPGIAYNIAHALWFAFFAAGAFGAAYNLIQNQKSKTSSKAIIYGLLAAVMIVLMGNLGGALEFVHQNGVGPAGFWKWLDIAELDGPATSGGGLTSQRGGWWWWRASRVINDYTIDGHSQHQGGTTVIDEFPQFSFILGDMHPHVLGLPFSLLAIMLAFNLYQANFRFQIPDLKLAKHRRPPATDQQPPTSNFQPPTSTLQLPTLLPTFFLYALILGALGFLNTWDYPIYVFLAAAAYGLRRWQKEGHTIKVTAESVLLCAALGITGIILYLPFYLSFESQARGLFPNLFNGTRFSQLFVMFGPFLIIGACFIAAVAGRARPRLWLDALKWTVIVLIVCIVVIPILLTVITLIVCTLAPLLHIPSPEVCTYPLTWLRGLPLPGLAPGTNNVPTSRLAGRLLGTPTLTPRADGTTIIVPGSGPWTLIILTFAIVLITIILLRREHFRPPDHPATPSPGHFALLIFATGALIILGIEFVFLGDGFGGTRMNTIFKFYYQVWALWSIATAYGAYYVVDSTENKQGVVMRVIQAALFASLILAGLVYPLMVIPSRMEQKTLTLDGTAYLAQENPDEYAAIQWLNANVPGSPIILEAPGDSFVAQTSRVSGYTGLPTLLGWRGHESQWRKEEEFGPTQQKRQEAITEIYNSRDLERTLALLRQYNISYIYVGQRERTQYSPFGLTKFNAIADVVFQQGNTTIYRVRQ